MTDPKQPDTPEADSRLLAQDVDGTTAGKKKGLSIKGTPREGGARLSKNFKKVAFFAGGVIAGGMILGIMTAGNKSSAPFDGSDSGAQQVGQTSPDIAAMQRAAAQAAAATPEHGASNPAQPHASASAPANPLQTPGATLATTGNPQQLTPAHKYHQWLEEQHYKELEGAVLAAQSAHLAKVELASPSAGGRGGAGSDTADALRRLALGAAPKPGDQEQALQKAIAALQGATGQGGADQPSPQQQNKGFLDAAQAKGDSGYLPAAVQPPLARHELFAGSVIPAVMLTGIDSDLPGTISAQVRQTVYDSLNPSVVLIPQGTRLIGEYSSEVAYGQSRVLVAWSRLIYPNGATIDLRGMEGTDGKGQAGFHDQVDNHSFRVFGSAILMSLLGVGAQLSQPQNSGALNTPSASQQAAAATAQQLNNVGTNLLNRNLNIQPTLVIRPGYAFNVLVNRTMILPPYPGQ
ncbi:TrbI/VirB10 family protein [Thiomonas sp.]|uniref:TrbI/VirB10 family protein n=1 Tax=Thiomonas sp. TaxID=2047785 RepID=UPI00260CBCFB|nr:TrbI/VirB10 family protein [Thiomonas sp.]